MPTYRYVCHSGHTFERFLRFAEFDTPQTCECGELAERRICAPMMVRVQSINYTSPIDGKPITTKQARIEDLKRSGCIEYDPGMRQDYDRRLKENDATLDRSVDDFVDKTVSEMPARKRESLQAELQTGAIAEPVRITPPQRSA